MTVIKESTATGGSRAVVTARTPAGATPFTTEEIERIRADFPVLSRRVHGDVPLVYLDSSATSQRPRPVLDAERAFLETSYAAVHRGAHALAEEATEAFEAARAAVGAFVGVDDDELVWTRNATEGINIVAAGVTDPSGEPTLRPGDEVVVTEMEHHANLLPWQRACARTGARLRWIPVTDDGRLDLAAADDIIGPRTKVLAVVHASNVLGTVNPVALLAARARAVGALTVLDACQSVPHMPVDVHRLGVDLAVFSAHKMLGPNGLGALAGRREVLDALPPLLLGGSIVDEVTMTTATFKKPPARFETGTQAISQTVALHAAVRYLEDLGRDRVAAHEHALTGRMLAGLAGIPGVRVLGPTSADDRIGAVSVVVDGVHPHDVGEVLDAAGIAVRVGHHCAQPVHRRFGVRSSTRASLYLYSTAAEVDAFLDALSGVRRYFGLV
ncbi:MAG TPA: SufS family cysteine desulfurase [Kineosporiaceae bacterium]|nr:SufS family cysteine desulfurase [Kineosporiaceae bacterium]